MKVCVGRSAGASSCKQPASIAWECLTKYLPAFFRLLVGAQSAAVAVEQRLGLVKVAKGVQRGGIHAIQALADC